MARSRLDRTTRVLLLLLLLLAGLGYAWGLTRYQAYDDEGGYLYAAWRIAEGEAPYRDFLTPQLPGFLYPGALISWLSDGSVLCLRASMILLVLLAGLAGFLLLHALAGRRAAFFALLLFASQHQIYFAARFFRPEAGMLFWGVVGYGLFALAHRRSSRGLMALAGIALGLSTMTKLFGGLMAAGLGLWVVIRVWQASHRREAIGLYGWFVAGYLLLVGGCVALFSLLAPGFVGAVLGHHLQQGAGTPLVEVVLKALSMYWEFGRTQPVYTLLALWGLVVAWRRRRSLGLALACQVATAVVFVGMTRDVQLRHLTYLAPTLAALAGIGLDGLAERLSPRGWARAVGVVGVAALVGLALYPEQRLNASVGGWEEQDTSRWVAYLQEITTPTDYVMSDYPGINFAARRLTTPLGAGLSEGATDSGQITGRDLIDEIEAYDVQVVLLNVGPGAHHLVSLVDYAEWKQYVQTHLALVDRQNYDARPIEIYVREDLWPGEITNYDFGHALALTGYQWQVAAAEPRQNLEVLIRWHALAALPSDYSASLQLYDDQGHQWGLGSKELADMDAETYLGDDNIEVAVLRPTSQWPVGETSLQVHELPIDIATPPGTYRVKLRVHPADRWDGLPVLDASSRREGYDVDLGTVTVLPPSEPHAEDELPIHTHVEQAMAPGIELLGISPVPETVLPGDAIELSLWWRCLDADLANDLLQLELLGESGSAGRQTEPIGGSAPSICWQEGDLLRQQIRLTVDREAAPGTYALRASLQRGDQTSAGAVLATVSVAPYARQFDEPLRMRATSFCFGDGIEVVGSHPTSASGGSDHFPKVTLYWHALETMDVSYTVSVRIADITGRIVAQQDRIPGDGAWPTTAWLPGEYVADTYTLEEPVEFAPGTYQVVIVWYDLETGVQLDVTASPGAKADANGAVIAQFDVR